MKRKRAQKRLEKRQKEFDSLDRGKQDARVRPGSMSGRK